MPMGAVVRDCTVASGRFPSAPACCSKALRTAVAQVRVSALRKVSSRHFAKAASHCSGVERSGDGKKGGAWGRRVG